MLSYPIGKFKYLPHELLVSLNISCKNKSNEIVTYISIEKNSRVSSEFS